MEGAKFLPFEIRKHGAGSEGARCCLLFNLFCCKVRRANSEGKRAAGGRS